MDQRYIAAIEIGSSKIKGAVGLIDTGGSLNIVAIEEEPLIGSVRYGCVQNVEEVSNHILSIKRKLENYNLISPRKITGVFIALGGRSLTSNTVNISRRLPAEMEITPSVIEELRNQARSAVNYTDKEIIAVEAGSFTVDGMLQPKPVGTYGHDISGRFSLLLCKPRNKNNILRAVERLDLKVNAFVVRPLAQADIVLTNDEKSLGCMLVDFGAETTTVSIYKDRSLCYLVALPIGSRNITRDLTGVLNRVEEHAEEIKRVVGNALPDATPSTTSIEGIDNTEINNYVQARAGEIIDNIVAQIKMAGFRAEDIPTGIILVGNGAKLKGFKDVLMQKSRLKVRIGAPSGLIRISDHRIQPSEAVDVIATIAAGAKLPGDCLTEAPENPRVTEHTLADIPAARPAEPRRPAPEEQSRIGRDEEDDDDDEADDYGSRTDNPRPADRGKRASSGSRSGFMDRIKERIVNIMSDRSDAFDDEEEDNSNK